MAAKIWKLDVLTQDLLSIESGWMYIEVNGKLQNAVWRINYCVSS